MPSGSTSVTAGRHSRRGPDCIARKGSGPGCPGPCAEHLAKMDPRKEQVVEMRFFGGLSVQETAEVLKISSETVMRDWKAAKPSSCENLVVRNPVNAGRWRQEYADDCNSEVTAHEALNHLMP